MSMVSVRVLDITYDNCLAYIGDMDLGLNLHTSSLLGTYYVIGSNSKGTRNACLNAAANDVLYPNSIAKPTKADVMLRGQKVVFMSASANMLVNNITFFTTTLDVDVTHENSSSGITTGIINSTKASKIKAQLVHTSGTSAGIAEIKLSFYFKRYSMSAFSSGNGISSANVSNELPWEGDSVTFTANIMSGAIWNGWYSDAACTNLVSTNLSYTITAGSDLVLYAKAIRVVVGTGTYFKVNGAYKSVVGIYKKENGMWIAKDKSIFDTSDKYVLKQ